MHLEPINTENNFAREVLAHIIYYWQLQRIVSHASSKKQVYTHHTFTVEALPICCGDLQSLIWLGLELEAVHSGLQKKKCIVLLSTRQWIFCD